MAGRARQADAAMRYGVLSDVHGNLPALEAVLDFLAFEGVDSYICAGDVVGYGPYPNECVERIASLPGVWVAGNHDLIAAGVLSTDRCDVVARETLEWTDDVLSSSARAILAGLPRLAELPDGVMAAHGSLADPEERIASPSRAAAELVAMSGRDAGAGILVVGHTHRAMAVDDRGRALLTESCGTVPLSPDRAHLINPGSVGQSRQHELRARVAILDLASREAHFEGLRYDASEVRAALRQHRLPRVAIHSPPRPRWRVTAGRVRRKVMPRRRA
jgi:predicted phosphodiesterase